MKQSETLSVGVVICTATYEREPVLRRSVAALLGARRAPEEVIVVVDRNPALARHLAATLPGGVQVRTTQGAGGNSAGRNVGIAAARTDVVAFVDDDGVADAHWLERLMAAFEAQPGLVGAGGQVVPHWEGDASWLPEELLWVAGCTYAGHRRDAGPIRNPIGCNMAFRRVALLVVGGFATEFGKNGGAFAICDETELCLRLAERFGEDRIVYVPAAAVVHHVSASRLTARGLVHRALSEGLSKGRLHRRYRDRALAAETGYVRRLLLRTVPGLLLRAVRHGDRAAARGAAAVVVTLAVTAASFAYALAFATPRPGGTTS
jgi:GT2 family glycosyltransferase